VSDKNKPKDILNCNFETKVCERML